jgi:ribosome modulation factor
MKDFFFGVAMTVLVGILGTGGYYGVEKQLRERSSAREKIFEDGKDAGLVDFPSEICPYEVVNPGNRTVWMEGWSRGKVEHRKSLIPTEAEKERASKHAESSEESYRATRRRMIMGD